MHFTYQLIPPILPTAPSTAGSTLPPSSSTASSLTQNLVPSTTTIVAPTSPSLARLGNSVMLTTFPSTLTTASPTRATLLSSSKTGVSPETSHSEMPGGAATEQALAASRREGEMMFRVQSCVEERLARESLGEEREQAKERMKSGGSCEISWK